MATAIDRIVARLMGLELDVEYLKRIVDKAMEAEDGKIKPLGEDGFQSFRDEVTALLKERYKDLASFEPAPTAKEATRDEQ